MHRQGVVHRDLKPANILLDRDGTPKLSDFGLARLLDSDPDGVPLTDTGALLGTAHYMAPERLFERTADIGKAADIYSLGAILYETLTGRPPFSGPNKLQVLDKARSEKPIPPSRLKPGIPAWLEEVCLKCLEKDPSLRYATAQELADDLDRWLRNDCPPVTVRRATRRWRTVRRPVAIALGLAAALSLVAMRPNGTEPDSAETRIEADLSKGRAVSLIGTKGIPRWSRWITGENRGRLTTAEDGVACLQSWDTSLFELVPDPKSERYRIRAQIRHDTSETAGDVGLYFARTAIPLNGRPLHVFVELVFNAVRGDADLRARIPLAHQPSVGPVLNSVKLRGRLLADSVANPPKPHVDIHIGTIAGPKFRSLGMENGKWHNIEIEVSPDILEFSWNGESFGMRVDELQNRIDVALRPGDSSRPEEFPLDLHPRINLRGGLGLYLCAGVASFRSVSVEPLDENGNPLK
jgi:serine/threonine-protein kinase